MLLWQHNRLQAVAAVIGSQNMNWDNPEVMKSIENMLTVDPDSVDQYIKESNLKFIGFVNENYTEIYAGT